MIKHILKIMWNQRRSNGWIFAELLVVAAVLWMMVDTFWVDYRTYHAPLGFDIGNVWRFKLSNLDVKHLVTCPILFTIRPTRKPDAVDDPDPSEPGGGDVASLSIPVPIRVVIHGGKSSLWMATLSMRLIWSHSRCATSHRNISVFPYPDSRWGTGV